MEEIGSTMAINIFSAIDLMMNILMQFHWFADPNFNASCVSRITTTIYCSAIIIFLFLNPFQWHKGKTDLCKNPKSVLVNFIQILKEVWKVFIHLQWATSFQWAHQTLLRHQPLYPVNILFIMMFAYWLRNKEIYKITRASVMHET